MAIERVPYDEEDLDLSDTQTRSVRRRRAAKATVRIKPPDHTSLARGTHTHITYTHVCISEHLNPKGPAKQVAEEEAGCLVRRHQDVNVQVQRIHRGPQAPALDDEQIDSEREGCRCAAAAHGVR